MKNHPPTKPGLWFVEMMSGSREIVKVAVHPAVDRFYFVRHGDAKPYFRNDWESLVKNWIREVAEAPARQFRANTKWSNVDWSQGNTAISEATGFRESTVRGKRHMLQRSGLI